MISDFFDDEEYLPKEVETKEEEIKEIKPKSNMFEVMSTVVNKKFMPTDEEIETINSFMMVRYLSGDPYGVQIATWIDRWSDMPIKAQYLLARNMMSDKIKYIKFPKKEKIANKNEVELVSMHYKCSDLTAIDYISRMPEAELNRIKDVYSYGKLR